MLRRYSRESGGESFRVSVECARTERSLEVREREVVTARHRLLKLSADSVAGCSASRVPRTKEVLDEPSGDLAGLGCHAAA